MKDTRIVLALAVMLSLGMSPASSDNSTLSVEHTFSPAVGDWLCAPCDSNLDI